MHAAAARQCEMLYSKPAVNSTGCYVCTNEQLRITCSAMLQQQLSELFKDAYQLTLIVSAPSFRHCSTCTTPLYDVHASSQIAMQECSLCSVCTVLHV
jgi:hypothetical protein